MTEVPMHTNERRIVVDERFERAVAAVVSAFVCEGFTVDALDGGDLRQRTTHGARRRYALLNASLPELRFDAAGSCTTRSALLGCRLSLFELGGSCTLIAVKAPLSPYPLLASLVPRLTERVGHALRLVRRRGSRLEAA
jgi:hypothetical protein